MHKELHVSHMPQPLKPVTIPLSSKKKQKKQKNRNYACAFFRLQHGLERSKRDRYIFIRTNTPDKN